MPFSQAAIATCKTIQKKYVDYFGQNAAEFRTLGDVALITWLLSAQNQANVERLDITSIPGKKNPVAMRFDSPYCFNLCRPTVDCTTARQAITNPTKEVVYEMTAPPLRICDGQGRPMRLELTEAELMKYCTETDTSYIDRQIFKIIARFEEGVNELLWSLLLPNVGTNGKGEAITNIPLFVKNTLTNTTVLNSDSLWYLNNTWKLAGNKGTYALIGGSTADKYGSMQKWAAGTDLGVDLTKVSASTPIPFYDLTADNALASNRQFLMMAPGAAQLIWWNNYRGEKARQVTDLYIKDVIVSPRTGLPIDFYWKYDPDCERYFFDPSFNADLIVNMPGGCAPLATSNGIIRVNDCSDVPLVPECPEA